MALISPEEEKILAHGSVFLIEINKVKPNPMQPRTEFDLEKLQDLADSIKQYGVLQPLVVSRKETETESGVIVEYELIAGERRLRASKLAGLAQVPIVIRKEDTDKTKLELAIIENLQREDLNALERAKAFKKLVDDYKLKHHEVATRVGKSREYVSNTLRLLGLPEEIQISLSRGEITEGHARTILSLDDRPEALMSLYREILDRKISVRHAERLSKNLVRSSLTPKELESLEIKGLEKQLADKLGTNVHIELNGGRGQIHIDFFSGEDLQNFLKKMTEERQAEEISEIIVEKPEIKDDTIIPPQAQQIKEDVDPVEEMLKNFSV